MRLVAVTSASYGRSPGRMTGPLGPSAMAVSAVVSMQVGQAVAKQSFGSAGPLGMLALRLGFGALILLVAWRPRLHLDRRTIGPVFAVGTALAGTTTLLFLAIARIPLGVAVAVQFLGPLAVAIAGSRRRLDLVWAALAGGGVFLLTDRAGGAVTTTGLVLAGGSAACWAAYILANASLGAGTRGGGAFALAIAWAAVLTVPVGLTQATTLLSHPHVLLAGLLVALASTVVANSLELEALRRMPPRVFGVLLSLEPVIAALAGLALLGEHLGAWQWLAVACVVTASVGATGTVRR